MKSFAFVLVVLQAIAIQNAFSQVIRAPICAASPVIASNVISQPSVAASLADTLSLLTVSSLLAETLPLNPNVIAAVPVAVGPSYVPAYGGCGCGCGCGGCGYNGVTYII